VLTSRDAIAHPLVAVAIELAKETISRAPELDSKGDLRSQVLKSSVSVALNLAEGIGKGEIQNFFAIARGSLVETCAGMTIAQAPGLIERYHDLCDNIDLFLHREHETKET
jgi:four helix bundle protein